MPKLCHAIEKSLALPDKNRKCPLGYFLTPKEFKKWVADDVSILLNDEETKVSIEYLDSSGIVSNQDLLNPCFYFYIDRQSGF